MNFGFNISNKGTIYLIDVLEIIYNSNNYLKMMLNLENNVYLIIAQKYNTKVSTLKSDIVKATERMYKLRCERTKKNNNTKVTPKAVIFFIIEKLKNEKIYYR